MLLKTLTQWQFLANQEPIKVILDLVNAQNAEPQSLAPTMVWQLMRSAFIVSQVITALWEQDSLMNFLAQEVLIRTVHWLLMPANVFLAPRSTHATKAQIHWQSHVFLVLPATSAHKVLNIRHSSLARSELTRLSQIIIWKVNVLTVHQDNIVRL